MLAFAPRRRPISDGASARRTAVVCALAIVAALSVGCRSVGEADVATLAAGSDSVLWNAATKDLAKKRYEAARQYLKRIIEGFPNSSFQPEARLALADSYFNEGGIANLILAAAEYREFGNLYPSHPSAEYAQFQVAECYFKQRRPPDRDQTNTQTALAEFERFVDLFPQAKRAAEASQRIAECRRSLARAEFLVGHFYQRTRQLCRAAIQRYQAILEAYPKYEDTDEVLLRLSECLVVSGRSAEALPHIDRLIESFPKSLHVGAARQLRERALRGGPSPGNAAPAATPPQVPSEDRGGPAPISSGTSPSAKNP